MHLILVRYTVTTEPDADGVTLDSALVAAQARHSGVRLEHCTVRTTPLHVVVALFVQAEDPADALAGALAVARGLRRSSPALRGAHLLIDAAPAPPPG